MTKLKSIYRCGECGGSSPKWLGRCPTCSEWNTLLEELDVEVTPTLRAGLASELPMSKPIPIGDVDLRESQALPTGIGELDLVLGGGLVPGSVTLVGGEPGIGKSTLLLQAFAAMAARGATTLIVTAEESVQQVRLRAGRLGTLSENLHLVAETNLACILAHIATLKPDLVLIDSIQTVFDSDLSSAPGSVSQVRECAQRFVREAKEQTVTTVLVGHVTKEGALAGPRVLEHLVDTVLSFEGDRHHALRVLRAVKHRFGSTHELGLFEMTEAGLTAVEDPSGLFLSDRREGVAGSVVVPTVDGNRPLLVEMQALVSSSSLPQPRRCALGIDSGRLSLLLAVLERRVGIHMGGMDVHASAVGGVRVLEPGADLAIALALVSSLSNVPLPEDLVAFGEVGLAGELRQVSQPERRLSETLRLGFRRAIVPLTSPAPPPGVEVLRASTLAEAIDLAEISATVH